MNLDSEEFSRKFVEVVEHAPVCYQTRRDDLQVGGDQKQCCAFGRVTFAPRSGLAEQLYHDIAIDKVGYDPL